jgi:hypothetical protein
VKEIGGTSRDGVTAGLRIIFMIFKKRINNQECRWGAEKEQHTKKKK